MTNNKKKTLIIGLGEVGRPLYTILSKAEPDAVGIDIEPTGMDIPVGIMHICFPFLAASQFEEAVAGYARKYRPELIVVNSTVVPGTTRSVETATGIPAVYSPVRGKHTKMVDELYHYVKFVAGTDESATARVGRQFEAAGMKTEAMSAPETLELAKLLETTYFGVLIAWAQEMNRFAAKVGGDYLEVGKFFREIGYLPDVLFQPGFIGGHCVMPNIALLEQRFESEFLETVKRSNELRKKELAAAEQKASDERLQPLSIG